MATWGLKAGIKMAEEKKMELEIEEIVKKTKILIEEKQVSDEELKRLQEHQSAMEKDRDKSTLKRLQFQHEQSYAQSEREMKGRGETKQKIEALRAQIKDEKLKRRKEKVAFEQQLEELIRKHQWTAEFYTPARLQLEMRDIMNSKQRLLSEEHTTKEKLNTIDKELNSLQQRGAASDEVIFLHSKEAKATHQLLEEENEAVKATLRELTQQCLDP
ncbi:synaptonemal complex central element protein 1-like isoform X2 [Narcine bancroftii]|uniref:synaptonemal complex central element protein 1-like isoform X2 n=1 Tax=Narcine bancroftii TaxID=1343680 RepID=UPI003831456A